MKKYLLILCLIIGLTNVFAQDLAYEVRGKYVRPVTKAALEQSNSLSDFIAGYPSKWVKDYVSVEILATENEKPLLSKSQNEVLTSEQKAVLKKLNLEDEVEVNVKYKNENAVTEQIDIRNMVVKMTVVPDIEAEFVGGYSKLKEYLKENLVSRIAENTPEEFQSGKVIFTIDEEGKVINPKISASSGDTETDNFLIEMLDKMPAWKPAKTSNGTKVKQQFEFSMGIGGC